ncbi:MAG: efflux RND transporter permease subunit [bacterium]|nr:efflux RND transporter permease subunit [bacterium]
MLPSFSVKRPFTIIVACIAIVVLGFTSLTKMSTSLIPELNLPYVVVYTIYPGASPEQMETTVTDPIESALSTTSGLKDMRSFSSESMSMIMLEFNDGVDMSSVMLELRESLDLLEDYLPDDSRTPSLLRINMDSLPIAVITVDLAGADQAEVSDYVIDEIEPALESVEGVASVNASGLIEQRMMVTIDTDKLKKKNEDIKSLMSIAGVTDASDMLTPEMIAQIIVANNMDFPAGYAYDGGNKMQVRVGNGFDTAAELEDLLLVGLEDADIEIRLGDVAKVEMLDNADDSYTKVNGNDAVIIQVQKQSEASTTAAAHAVEKKVEQLQKDNPDLHMVMLMDQGEYVDMVLDSLSGNLIFGAILAVLVLFLFLRSWKMTGVVALSIPLSIVFALLLMYFTGISLNMISLSGLALGVGMLVDNSIVVIENIYRTHEEEPDAKASAVKGARQVTGAILASTLTTCAVFLPFAFASGLVRQLFVDLALTICFSLLASLVVALTFVPMMCSGALRGAKMKRFKTFDKIVDKYALVLDKALKRKWIPLVAAGTLFVAAMVIVGNMGTQFFPEMNTNQMTTTLHFEDEDTYDDKVATAEKLMAEISEMEGVDSTGVTISSGSNNGQTLSSGTGNSVTIYTLLEDKTSVSSIDLAKEIDSKAEELGIDASSASSMMDISAVTGQGVTIALYGYDLDGILELSRSITADLEAMDGVGEVTSSYAKPKDEFRIVVNKDKAMEQGLTVAQVYQEVAILLADSQNITSVSNGPDDYPVYIAKSDAKDEGLKDLENLKIKSPTTGSTVKLKDIAEVKRAEGYQTIAHDNQSRVITITASVADGYNIGKLGGDINEYVADLELPEGYRLETSGEAEEIADAMGDLMRVLLLAIILVYLVMVAQFQSLKYPFIIMFTLPLCYTGAVFGLLVCGMDLSLVAVIGMVILTGIVVNNGIIFVDFANQMREEGMNIHDALIATGRMRIRPILITALTTIVAMFLMALGRGMGSQLSQPMAVAVIGGLLYSTLLTLFIVPTLYMIFDKEKRKTKKAARKAARAERASLAAAGAGVDGSVALPSSDYESSALPEGAIEDFEAQLDAVAEDSGLLAEGPDDAEEILDAEVVDEPQQAIEADEMPDSEADE